MQKVKEQPEKNYKYPSSWGPYECLYCVSEAYRRLCEKHKEAVPLLRLRPRNWDEPFQKVK